MTQITSMWAWSKEFTDCAIEGIAGIDPQLAAAHFSKGPEILPGWTLRLNLTKDGKGYDLLLEDTSDEKCGYAAVTDERGIIRQKQSDRLPDLSGDETPGNCQAHIQLTGELRQVAAKRHMKRRF